jgi:hypothetical protein
MNTTLTWPDQPSDRNIIVTTRPFYHKDQNFGLRALGLQNLISLF